jgi:uncharacterized OsmC-like protein
VTLKQRRWKLHGSPAEVTEHSTEEDWRMETEQLKSLQAPLKQKYREDPKSALITLRAQARLGEGITCKVETGKALVKAGLHPATGGDGLSACSGDMLLEALAACAGVTLRAVATATGIPLRDATITAEGDLDFRGTLAVAKDVPVGLQRIRLKFDLDSDATREQLETLIRLTERYCVVYQTLSKPAEITVTYE